jgi:hypothetical protein
MPFLSFENFTIANAIKTIARSLNAIPKVFGTLVNAEVPYIENFKLTFINRNGNETAIDSQDLNTKFPIAYEHNANSSDQFLTRSVSNISNAKSSTLVIAPQQGGFKNVVPNALTFDNDNRDLARVVLPSKIDKIEFVNVIVPITLQYLKREPSGDEFTTIYRGYYTNRPLFIEKLQNSGYFGDGVGFEFTLAQLQEAINNLPFAGNFYKVNYGQEIDKDYRATNTSNSVNVYHKKMSLLNKFGFDTVSKVVGGLNEPDLDVKNRTIHWLPNSNEIIMPLSFRNGLTSEDDHNIRYYLVGNSNILTDSIILSTDIDGLREIILNEEILIQVGYYPIADIKVSYDNDNEAQDEKFFNQSGKVIDSFSTSQLIISHTNDSVEGTKVRNARYDNYANIVPLGQIVRDNNELYVVSQRSIDMMFRDNGNNYFNVIYTLSKNRIARSENIQADSAVINYKTPDDNLVSRTQLYKDYIELSLVNGNKDLNPYLPMAKSLVLSPRFAGTNFDFTVLAKNTYGSTTIRYVKSPTVFDLAKSKLLNVNWQDNNLLGFRLERASGSFVIGGTLVQTPVVYTNSVGKATNFELVMCDTENIIDAQTYYNEEYTPEDIIPFNDLTNVNNNFYTNSVLNENNFTIRITEPNYDKDAFEIPVFEYMIQGNDNYNALGNVLLGNELFASFEDVREYHFVISNTRFTVENHDNFWPDYEPTENRVIITRTNDTEFRLRLYSSYFINAPFTQTLNSVDLQNKHIGVYAVNGANDHKFLFAINDYNMESDNDINLYINNWKI